MEILGKKLVDYCAITAFYVNIVCLSCKHYSTMMGVHEGDFTNILMVSFAFLKKPWSFHTLQHEFEIPVLYLLSAFI